MYKLWHAAVGLLFCVMQFYFIYCF